MRIGIDCRKILNPSKGEAVGIGHYIYQLVRHLLKINTTDQFVLFFDKSVEQRRLKKFKQDNVKIIFFPFSEYQNFVSRFYSDHLVSAILQREKLDLYHSPCFNTLPPYQKKSVITVHDLTIFKCPELFCKKEYLEAQKIADIILPQVNKIIVPSHATKNDIIEMFSVNAQNIKVISHGLDKRFFKKATDEQINAIKKKYSLQKKYILFLGTLDLRKNISGMLRAFKKFKERTIKDNYQLVLAGNPGKNIEQIKKEIKQLNLTKQVILPGYIEAEDLVPLFSGAVVFLFPTLYEGFGLPVIEAMASNCPVITSNTSALPEIVDGKALLVNPHSVSDIFKALIKIIDYPQLADDLRQAGKEWVKQFSWEETVKETLILYKQVFSNK